MSGNATHRFANTAVLSVETADATRVVTSGWFDEALSDTYRRVGLRPGLLERLAGVRERRWWADGVTFVDGAATAGAKAISESGVDPAGIGLMVNTSVSRRYLEPSTAVAVHHALGLPRSCQNFDVTNACLGFVNGMELAAAMIDSGRIDYALVVNGEDSRPVQERTIDRLSRADTASGDVLSQFATLTLGSGAAAMVLGRADRHPEGHRLVASVSRAGTEHHELCVGDNDLMRTDLKGLLDAGLALSLDMWADAAEQFDWHRGLDRYVMHQVSRVHTQAMCDHFAIDPGRVPRTFPTRGNLGPASVPYTLAGEVGSLSDGDRVLLMGIGSGLNVCCLELAW
ncbi:3-oxoacyl-ACP synthase III [Geodermatophilus sabuli]|uniref:3-oxoacyl-[acyl-carrier-protein] synthase-3 n=1 Tax=Geodermatophilus sabuli TaxID=1564158 RepID=A0A285EE93_9ACTN|nr:3-oxoacyl-ACP synthase III [Geodermatophilus sabuli]MBB3084334.1 3-oxoacyl-[acyl-carrier-protein] synthase-3 [Geodermatophilus sabuli]SNX96396.1 3-oxoacyl-[acyl-carrier-protein] synthase-3 [Geodermatophilus sabuli]